METAPATKAPPADGRKGRSRGTQEVNHTKEPWVPLIICITSSAETEHRAPLNIQEQGLEFATQPSSTDGTLGVILSVPAKPIERGATVNFAGSKF